MLGQYGVGHDADKTRKKPLAEKMVKDDQLQKIDQKAKRDIQGEKAKSQVTIVRMIYLGQSTAADVRPNLTAVSLAG